MRIAVIGVGPRGLSVLERVVSHARRPGPPVELLLIEPGDLGTGIHRPEQPGYLLLNTIAGQLTIFSDERMTPGAPVTTGPSFLAWCRARLGPVGFGEFLPRRLLGEYLRWAAGEFLARAPDRLSVRHLPAVATDVRPGRDGAAVRLADGTEHQVDLSVVTTGHGLAGAAAAGCRDLITGPYPLPDQVGEIPAGATVALVGTGLTAMDVIAALTVGRGGEFAARGYQPSGREPRIVLVNRSGLLPCARPVTPPGRLAAPARYLTREAIAALRDRAPGGRLDFRRDVEPLVRREAMGRMSSATAAQTQAVQRLLRPQEGTWAGYRRYRAALLGQARRDLREAERGLGTSPVKEGLEVLRDHRDILRAAVDAPGLTEESHRYFTAEYVPLVNRAVIGPQQERIRELLLLMASGIVLAGPGPRPALTRTRAGWVLRSTRLERPHRIAADVVVRANLSWPAADPALDPVSHPLRTCVAAGPGGGRCLAIDRDGFAVPRSGTAAIPAVAVFGPPAEGASYYNHYVPSPGAWSRALTDLDRVLRPVLTRENRKRPAHPSLSLVPDKEMAMWQC
jgi:FAD-NAD(P)-binding